MNARAAIVDEALTKAIITPRQTTNRLGHGFPRT
jgi:hypothetical protein